MDITSEDRRQSVWENSDLTGRSDGKIWREDLTGRSDGNLRECCVLCSHGHSEDEQGVCQVGAAASNTGSEDHAHAGVTVLSWPLWLWGRSVSPPHSHNRRNSASTWYILYLSGIQPKDSSCNYNCRIIDADLGINFLLFVNWLLPESQNQRE